MHGYICTCTHAGRDGTSRTVTVRASVLMVCTSRLAGSKSAREVRWEDAAQLPPESSTHRKLLLLLLTMLLSGEIHRLPAHAVGHVIKHTLDCARHSEAMGATAAQPEGRQSEGAGRTEEATKLSCYYLMTAHIDSNTSCELRPINRPTIYIFCLHRNGLRGGLVVTGEPCGCPPCGGLNMNTLERPQLQEKKLDRWHTCMHSYAHTNDAVIYPLSQNK
eukprot:GHVU01192802.1.p1 GENE.GHVU01192802.1~~GHVU01192802.1.p1  ORF type:complete len:219 (-),score=14.22 GHVU01192802.1:135-791(-)